MKGSKRYNNNNYNEEPQSLDEEDAINNSLTMEHNNKNAIDLDAPSEEDNEPSQKSDNSEINQIKPKPEPTLNTEITSTVGLLVNQSFW